MATLILDVRPGDDHAFVKTFDLEGISVRLEFRWLPRLGRWMCGVQTAAGVPAGPGFLAQPGGRILFDSRRTDLPSGTLTWYGADDYDRNDLGSTVWLEFDPTETTVPPGPYDVFARVNLS